LFFFCFYFYIVLFFFLSSIFCFFVFVFYFCFCFCFHFGFYFYFFILFFIFCFFLFCDFCLFLFVVLFFVHVFCFGFYFGSYFYFFHCVCYILFFFCSLQYKHIKTTNFLSQFQFSPPGAPHIISAVHTDPRHAWTTETLTTFHEMFTQPRQHYKTPSVWDKIPSLLTYRWLTHVSTYNAKPSSGQPRKTDGRIIFQAEHDKFSFRLYTRKTRKFIANCEGQNFETFTFTDPPCIFIESFITGYQRMHLIIFFIICFNRSH
jgi:hypothetical protein